MPALWKVKVKDFDLGFVASDETEKEVRKFSLKRWRSFIRERGGTRHVTLERNGRVAAHTMRW